MVARANTLSTRRALFYTIGPGSRSRATQLRLHLLLECSDVATFTPRAVPPLQSVGQRSPHRLAPCTAQEVHTKDSQQIAFKAALQDPHTLSFSDEFTSKHHRLSAMFRRYAARGGSQWKVASTEAAPPKNKKALVTHVDTLEDFRRWLISARRFSSWAGVGIDGVDVRRGGISRYGRETASVA